MKINNKRELQNIAINHSADIDSQDFINIYRECTKEQYTFLLYDLEKIYLILIKMTITDQIKILDKKNYAK